MSNEKLQAEVKSVLLDVDAQRLTVEAAQNKLTNLYTELFKEILHENLPVFLAGVITETAAAVQEGA